MRFLHTSDWHIGKELYSFSLLQDQEYYLEQFCELAKTKKVDAVIIAGDLYHRSVPSADAVLLLNRIFNHLVEDLKIPVLAIAGNHDSPERLAFGSSLYEKSGLYLESILKSTIKKITLKDEFGPINFYLLPYFELSHFRNLFPNEKIHTFEEAYRFLFSLPENQLNLSERNILIAHGLFSKKGSHYESSESERIIGGLDLVDSSIFDHFNYVALGHLHSPQKAGTEYIRYSGSILKYSLSEASQKKGVLLVNMDTEETAIQNLEIKPKRDLRVLKGSLDEIVKANENQENMEDFVYAYLTDPMLYDGIGKLRAIFPNTLGLQLDSKNQLDAEKTKSLSLEKFKQLSISELFNEFFENFAGRSLNIDEKKVMNQVILETERKNYK